MKKWTLLVFLTLICCLLCACDPGTFHINQETLKERVVSVELIQYENPDQNHFASWVPNHFDDLVPFVVENATVLETLPAEKVDEFLEAFSQTDILHTYYAYDSPKDVCLRLNYENGDFLIVWANYARNSFGGYIGTFSADGTVLSFWGSFSGLFYYEDLVNQYFNYTLPQA